jgi:hypothetical protein
MKKLAVAMALVAAGASSAVFAEGATYEYPDAFKSTVTRAAVQANAAAAQRAGDLQVGEVNVVAQPLRSTVTRAQVLAEAREAQRLGLTSGGETTPEPTLAQLRAIQLAGERATAPQVAGAAR